MTNNDKQSVLFSELLGDLVAEFREVEERMHARVDALLEEEATRLTRVTPLPEGLVIGETTVYDGGLRCTVTSARVQLTCESDDYYSPARGVESLGQVVDAYWVYTIQPPPTPKRGTPRPARTVIAYGVPSWTIPIAGIEL